MTLVGRHVYISLMDHELKNITQDKIISMHEMLKWKYAIYSCPGVRIQYVSSPAGQAASIAKKPCTKMRVRAELRHHQHEAEHFTVIIKAEHFTTVR